MKLWFVLFYIMKWFIIIYAKSNFPYRRLSQNLAVQRLIIWRSAILQQSSF